MPTEPWRDLLAPDLSKTQLGPTIEAVVPLLTELVNDATQVFRRCLNSSSGERDFPILFSYLHIIEMTDGIKELVAEACSAPALPILRSSFEALLAIGYILQADSDKRSSAYLVAYAHRRMRAFNLFDSETDEGAKFIQALSRDAMLGSRDLTPVKAVVRRVKAFLEELIGRQENRDAEEEYMSVQDRRDGRPFEWYHLFGGPRSLRKLARQLNYEAAYDSLYDSWSAVAHAQDLARFFGATESDEPTVSRLRALDDNDLKTVVVYATSIMLRAKRLVVEKFLPSEKRNAHEWFRTEIQDTYEELA